MFIKRFPEIWAILLGPNCKNLGLFLFILIPNLLASLLEGASFGLILGAISVLSAEPLPLFLKFLPFLGSLSQNEQFLSLLISAIVCQGVRSLIAGIAFYANTVFAMRVQEKAQHAIYRTIFSFSYGSISQYKTGDLVEYTTIPAACIPLILGNANHFLVNSLMILTTLVLMFTLDSKLALLTLLFLLLAAVIYKVTFQKLAKASEELSTAVVSCSKETVQAFQSIRTIFTYNRQDYVSGKISKTLIAINTMTRKVYLFGNSIPVINELLGLLIVTSILLIGMKIVPSHQDNALPILITFIALTHRLAIRLQMTNIALSQILTYKGSLLRLEEILATAGKEFARVEGIPFSPFTNAIQFKNVGLSYPLAKSPTLKNISLTIHKGETVAFVGSSGSGKSSLLDLLIGLYEPSAGEIEIDGIDLKKYCIGSWRDRLGVVSQDFAVFNDTIEENIRFGLKDKTDREISEAAKVAGLEPFIHTLPAKYQTIIGERGYRLSGGQKQRLALARALLRNPDILILDEATSSLDSESEYFIQNALEHLSTQQTVLIVAHRLSTILKADHIYVLEDGQIVEEGTHSSLLEQNGPYAKFWERQVHGHAYSTYP